MSEELLASVRKVAALFGDFPFVPPTWPVVREFLAALEAHDAALLLPLNTDPTPEAPASPPALIAEPDPAPVVLEAPATGEES